MFNRVLALETVEGDIKVAYYTPGVSVAVDGSFVEAQDAEGNSLAVECYLEYELRETYTYQDFWDEVYRLRNTDVRLRLVGG
jgi:hypothetical protein